MKIKRRQTPEIVIEKYLRIATDYNAGLPVKVIAERNDCSVETVYHALKRVEILYQNTDNKGKKDE